MSFVDCVAAAIPRLITFSASWKRIGFAAAALFCLLQPALAAEPPRTNLAGHVLPVLGESTRIARKSASDGNEALTLTVVLKRDDEAGFQQFLADVQDPASSSFHRFADPVSLADRFGPSGTAYAAVRTYFTSQGFAVTEDSTDRLTLTLRGTVHQAESALAVDIVDFSLGDRAFHANENEPSLPVRHRRAGAGGRRVVEPRHAAAELVRAPADRGDLRAAGQSSDRDRAELHAADAAAALRRMRNRAPELQPLREWRRRRRAADTVRDRRRRRQRADDRARRVRQLSDHGCHRFPRDRRLSGEPDRPRQQRPSQWRRAARRRRERGAARHRHRCSRSHRARRSSSTTRRSAARRASRRCSTR